MTIQTLKESVASRILALTTPREDGELSPVNAAVADLLAKRETDKRTEAIVKSFDLLDSLNRDIRKFKPKPSGYTAEGAVISEVWTKEDVDARNKAQQKIDKVVVALNKALDENDFGKLYDFAKGNVPDSE
jgi:hypothetical protein